MQKYMLIQRFVCMNYEKTKKQFPYLFTENFKLQVNEFMANIFILNFESWYYGEKKRKNSHIYFLKKFKKTPTFIFSRNSNYR